MLRAPFVSIPPNAQTRRNQNTNNPFSYNILLASFTCGKIIISLFVLRTETEHTNMLRHWLICATLCDLINAAVLIIDTKRLISSQLTSFHRVIESNNATPLLDLESPQTSRQETNSPTYWTPSRIILTANNCYYLVLWIWGHFLYYSSCTECFQSMEAITNVVFLYLYCGYFYLGAALLMAIFDHSYLSFITFSHLSLASKSKTLIEAPTPALPCKLYSLDTTTGVDECYICLANYQQGDDLAELPCDSKHQFHHKCIKQWLKINNACPLCRKTVGKYSKAKNMNEVELPVMII